MKYNYKLGSVASVSRGFTLIELLIVIVIIGVLAGILLTVIDPAKQQQKAREAVLRSTVEKGCLALHACASTTSQAMSCDQKAEVGIKSADGVPLGAVYYLGATSSIVADGAVASNSSPVFYAGVLGTCRFYCSYDFGTGAAVMLTKGGNTCLISDQ